MSLLLVESFRGIATADANDRYVNRSLAQPDVTVATASPRWSTGGYGQDANSQTAEMLFLPSPVTWPLYIEMGIKHVAGHPKESSLFELLGWQGSNIGSASASHFGGLQINGDGTISVYHKDTANTLPVLATSLKALHEAWYHLQARWNIDGRADDATGQVEVYVDGQLWITYDGTLVHNPNEDSYIWDAAHQVFLSFVGVQEMIAPSTGKTQCTDVVVCDSAGSDHIGFQGCVDVETLRPDGAGNYAQFTPSAGSNYQNVDETTPDGNTTYNASSTANHRDSYAMSALARATGVVKAVMLNLVGSTPEASIQQAKLFLRAGGTDLDGTAQAIGQSYKHKRQAFNTDADASAWTIAQVNAMEAGVQRL